MSEKIIDSDKSNLAAGDKNFLSKAWVGQAKIYSALFTLSLNIAHAVFTTMSLWRCSPNPKVSIKGAIAKLWAIVFLIYLIGVNYKFVVGSSGHL